MRSGATDHVSLEDSWLLDINLSARTFSVLLDLMLTPGHELYTPDHPGEAHCYRRGWLEFHGIVQVHLLRGEDEPTPDPDGSEDWGNFYLTRQRDGSVRLESNLGEIVVVHTGDEVVRFLDAPD